MLRNLFGIRDFLRLMTLIETRFHPAKDSRKGMGYVTINFSEARIIQRGPGQPYLPSGGGLGVLAPL
jgi:hypothetical protein